MQANSVSGCGKRGTQVMTTVMPITTKQKLLKTLGRCTWWTECRQHNCVVLRPWLGSQGSQALTGLYVQNHSACNQAKSLLGDPACGPSFAASPALPPPELLAPSCQILHIGKNATYKNMLHQQQAYRVQDCKSFCPNKFMQNGCSCKSWCFSTSKGRDWLYWAWSAYVW